MDDQVLWFEWKREDAIDPVAIHAAVKDGGMGLAGMRILGEFHFADETATLQGATLPSLIYEGPKRDNGLWDVEVIGYEPDGELEVFAIKPYKRPANYQQ
jgi:hypothetical protein